MYVCAQDERDIRARLVCILFVHLSPCTSSAIQVSTTHNQLTPTLALLEVNHVIIIHNQIHILYRLVSHKQHSFIWTQARVYKP